MVALLMIGGCTPAAEPAAPEAESMAPAQDLADTSWDCYEFAVGATPMPVLSTAPITMQFGADGTLSGNSGVNTYTTSYKTDGTSIEIGEQIASTMMAGEEDAMKQEADFLVTLPTAATFNITDNGELVLFGPAENMIVRARPAE